MWSVLTRYKTPCLPPSITSLVPGTSMAPEESRSASVESRYAWLVGVNQSSTFRFGSSLIKLSLKFDFPSQLPLPVTTYILQCESPAGASPDCRLLVSSPLGG